MEKPIQIRMPQPFIERLRRAFRESRHRPLELKVLVIAVISLFGLTSCWTTPRYYKERTRFRQLHCFDTNSIASYEVGKEISGNQLTGALCRVNGIFAGRKGMDRAVFERQKDDRCVPGEDPDPGELAAHVTAFTEPAPAEADIAVENKSDAADAPTKDDGDTKAKTGPKKKKQASTGYHSEGLNSEGNYETQLSTRVQLVISAYLYTLQPADRLNQVYTLITPLSPGVDFVGIPGPRATSLIAAGKVTSLQELAATVGPPAGQPVPVTIQPKLSRSLEEQIARQYTTQNVVVFPLRNVLLVSEDAGPGEADISGNTVTNVTLQFPPSLCKYVDVWQRASKPESPTLPHKARNAKKQPPIPSVPEEDKFEPIATCYIQRVPALVASVAVARIVDANCTPHTLSGLLARIPAWLHLISSDACGERTVAEDDDVVNLMPFKTAAVVELWRNPQSLYGFDLQDRQRKIPLLFDNGKGSGRMLFKNAAQAAEFRDWIIAQVRQGHEDALVSGTLEWKKGATRVGFGGATARWNERALQLCTLGTPLPNVSGPAAAAAGFPERADVCVPEQ